MTVLRSRRSGRLGRERGTNLFEKMGFGVFTLVCALVLLFIAAVFVFPNPSLYKKFFGAEQPTPLPRNASNATNFSVPVLQAGSASLNENNDGFSGLAFACVADAQKHGYSAGSASSLGHCLSEYELERRSKPKAYGEACLSHDECPPSVVWTDDAHHGECPSGAGFRCSVRCASDGDCSFKTGGVLAQCCRECAAGQPFGFCVK